MIPFSVLLSLYKKENPDFLSQALHSVFEQSCIPTEVILVLDGEITDQLWEVVNRFQNNFPKILKIVPLDKNVGLGAALNEGLKCCSYDIVARMDTDDISKPDRFEKQIKIFETSNDIAVLGTWIDEFSDNPSIIESTRKTSQYNQDILVCAKIKNPMNHQTVMFRKKIVESVGGYQSFYLFEDYWLWIRMLKAGFLFFNIQESLVLARGGISMAARRGGWKYAVSEFKFFHELYKINFLGFGIFIKNVIMRFPVRIVPAVFRFHIYGKILR